MPDRGRSTQWADCGTLSELLQAVTDAISFVCWKGHGGTARMTTEVKLEMVSKGMPVWHSGIGMGQVIRRMLTAEILYTIV